MVASKENVPLLAELLAEQQRLDTPVARFATAHSETRQSAIGIRHSSLIPLTAPRPGEQYAFEVDLDACSGCKACVAACHSLNGLDDTETWRDVGLLVSHDRAHPFTQTVTTACHHCADSACLNGCPVLAYEKDPLTGIVRHLDDQCIGCSYCVLKCPYDVPKFNARLGIVRKCDLCHGRLAHGEAPACAQACPTHAIKIVTVTVGGALCPDTATAESGHKAPPTIFLPGAPDRSYTQPTTRYVSKRPLPSALAAADHATLRPQPPHWPLIALLTLMPMAVGCQFAATALLGRVTYYVTVSTSPFVDSVTYYVTLIGWFAGAAALAASVFHLGQPLRAWRVFLGWRKSWLSREALALGAWFTTSTVAVALNLAFGTRHSALSIAPAAFGALALFCSVMVYVDTRRAFWRFAHAAPRFFGTAVVLGLAGALASPGAPHWLGLALALATFVKLAFEAGALKPLRDSPDDVTPQLKTALLLTGPLRLVNEARLLLGVIGGIVLPLAVALGVAPPAFAWPALALSLAGELAERYLFFRAVDAPKMPGVPA